MKKVCVLVISIITLVLTLPSTSMGTGNPYETPMCSNKPQDATSAQTQHVVFSIYLPVLFRASDGYFVSPNGSDTNPGTFSLPWKTITHAVGQIYSGDTLYIREGVYQEHFWIEHNGTETHPIIVTNYSDEEVVIDGNNYSNPPHDSGTPLVGVVGDWVVVSNLTINYSGDSGVYAGGDHVTLDNLYVHHNWGAGMILSGDYDIGQKSRIWSNSMLNEQGQSTSGSFGISAARYPNYAIIRKNVVWENWGEGISTFESNGTILEDNISHDNFSTNIYISDSTNVLCQRNFVYMDPSSPMNGYGDNAGIMMGDERYAPPSADITIINNVAYGNSVNLWWWQGIQGGGMNNVLIAYNTLINATSALNLGRGNIDISRGDHFNVVITNNLVQQDGELPVIATIDQPGVYYAYNLWSKKPDDAASGPGDIIADPLLAEFGTPFSPDWFRLLDSSPAIDHALSLPEVLVDYFDNWRDSTPDMGAVEYIP